MPHPVQFIPSSSAKVKQAQDTLPKNRIFYEENPMAPIRGGRWSIGRRVDGENGDQGSGRDSRYRFAAEASTVAALAVPVSNTSSSSKMGRDSALRIPQ